MTPKELAEIQMCDECISHLMENAGPDHIIVKYRTALIKLQEQAEEIKRLNAESETRRKIGADAMMAIDRQNAKITGLEDALVEERAWRNFFAANARTEALADFGYSLVKDRHFTRAREQLRAEGVIR